MISAVPSRPVSSAPGPGFILPREPRLDWHLLNPLRRPHPLPPPFATKPTSYLFWARNGLYHGLAVLGLRPGDRVLVPAFHCASLVEPLLQFGASVDFYRIDAGCAPDLDDIVARITDRTRAVLAIHYFGFPQLIRALRALCTRHGLFLIEDCAHVLTGYGEGGVLGEFGDISVFSWRKFLPVHDGGQLVVNNSKLPSQLSLAAPTGVLRLRVWKNILDRLIDPAPDARRPRWSESLQRLSRAGRRLLTFRPEPPGSLGINTYSMDFDRQTLGLEMSAPSRRILNAADIPAITEARRRHYRRLAAAAGALPELLPLFPELPDGVCPWVFPVVARGRVGFHLTLRSRGIPATTWGSVIHPDLPIDRFPDAAFLYENLVFLPIHQSLTAEHIGTMIAILAEELSRPR